MNRNFVCTEVSKELNEGEMMDLVGEKDSLRGEVLGGLDPGVAGEVDGAAGEALDDDALQEELPLVAVGHRDGSRLTERCHVHHELRRVHHVLPLHPPLLAPVPHRHLPAPHHPLHLYSN